jgi:hypothetical protein
MVGENKMPQAPQWLRNKFPGDDAEALAVLEANFNDDRGMLSLKDPTYKMTDREWEAILYLVHEWDYGYKGAK